MGFFDWLSGLFGSKKLELTKEELLDNSTCPQCWGHTNFGDQMREIQKDHTKDLVNKSARNAFVRDFIDKHVTGIKLKTDGDKMVCPKCKSGYKMVNTKAN